MIMSDRSQTESSSKDDVYATWDDNPWDSRMDDTRDALGVTETVPERDPEFHRTIPDTGASQQLLDTTPGVNVTQPVGAIDTERELDRLRDESFVTQELVPRPTEKTLKDIHSWAEFPSSGDWDGSDRASAGESDATSELMGNLRMPLLLFTDDEADTLVYIDPAPPPPQRHHWLPTLTTKSEAIPHRVHSRVLLGSNSTVLKNLFEPRNQSRVRKSRGLTGNMPPGIKYAVDLSPASEGDDAVIFMTELSCPTGVRKWSKYEWRWKLPAACVAGQDEVEWLPVPEPVVKIEKPKVSNQDRKRAMGKCSKHSNPLEPPRVMNWEGNMPSLPLAAPEGTAGGQKMINGEGQHAQPIQVKKVRGLPLDYSPIRHRTCLERILHALEGLDPKLDTAPKLWTFFALAKLLEVATLPTIGDRILMWLYDASNAMFVEVNPELSYQIGCGTQNLALCRDSFAILVGEEALLLLLAEANNQTPPKLAHTLHGRSRETLDDMEIQRIEYASKGFVERILNGFVDFTGAEMAWVSDLVRRNIVGPLEPEMASAVTNLTGFLQKRVRFFIYWQLHTQKESKLDDRFSSSDTNGYPDIDFFRAPSVMPDLCRVLTRSFWDGLKASAASLPYGDKLWRIAEHSSLKDLAPHLPVFKDQDDATIRWIARQDLILAVNSFNELANHRHTSTWIHMGISQFLETWRNQPNVSVTYFDLTSFEGEVDDYFVKIADKMAAPPEADRINYGVRFNMVDTLVCMGEEEYKFLPLWAGGNDDGSGGVFNDQDVPILESGGFSTAGPSVHTGSTVPSVADSMESFDTLYPSDAASTVQHASHRATDSHGTDSDVLSLGSTAVSSVGSELREGLRSLDLEDGQNDGGRVPEININIDFSDDTHDEDSNDGNDCDEDMSDDGTIGTEASDDESFALDTENHEEDSDLEDFELISRDEESESDGNVVEGNGNKK
jgi:hypothetical protein